MICLANRQQATTVLKMGGTLNDATTGQLDYRLCFVFTFVSEWNKFLCCCFDYVLFCIWQIYFSVQLLFDLQTRVEFHTKKWRREEMFNEWNWHWHDGRWWFVDWTLSRLIYIYIYIIECVMRQVSYPLSMIQMRRCIVFAGGTLDARWQNAALSRSM